MVIFGYLFPPFPLPRVLLSKPVDDGTSTMFGPTSLTTLLFALHATTAQQFKDHIFPYELLGLSGKCFSAVNTTVASCPGWLRQHAGM